MSFLYPSFLFALAAIAIPIIIHLFHFRRFKIIYFTNVKFLRSVQEETATKNKLKHILILLARILAITFLVFSFAQPFWKKPDQLPKNEAQVCSIYIDNSFSMESKNNDASLLQIAQKKANEIVQSYGPENKFQLLTNDFEARHQMIVNKEEMLQFIDAIQLSPVSRNVKDVVQRQKDILQHEGFESASIFIISDFQQNTTDIQGDSLFRITLLPLVSNKIKNISIDSVWFNSPLLLLNQQAELCFKISNFSKDEVENISMNLVVNEQIKGIHEVAISAESFTIDTMVFVVSDLNPQNCVLSITDYPITFDDQFYFTFQPLKKIPVVSIYAQQENIYLQSFFSNEIFSHVSFSESNINYNIIQQASCIVLDQLNSLPSGLEEVIQLNLEKGGSVIIFPSFNQNLNDLNQLLSKLNCGQYGEIVNGKRNVGKLNNESSFFHGVFENLPKNLSLPFALRSYNISSSNHVIEEVLLELTDKSPFFVGYKTNGGNVFLSATPLDKTTTDFAVTGGIFVPIMFQIAALSMQSNSMYAIIGEQNWIKINQDFPIDENMVTIKNESSEFIPMIKTFGTHVEINASSYAQESGIYFISIKDKKIPVALNYNRKESDLKFYSKEELNDKYANSNISVLDGQDKNLTQIMESIENGEPLWKYCLIFALLFLAIEIALFRFMP